MSKNTGCFQAQPLRGCRVVNATAVAWEASVFCAPLCSTGCPTGPFAGQTEGEERNENVMRTSLIRLECWNSMAELPGQHQNPLAKLVAELLQIRVFDEAVAVHEHQVHLHIRAGMTVQAID